MDPDRHRRALFVGNDIYRRAAFGRNHPLSIARVEKVAQLCRAMNWLPNNRYRVAPTASRAQLEWFHAPDYLDALASADESGRVSRETREQFGFGTMENPLFAGVYERAATSVGGSILSAELALQGRVVFHPAGGTHHAAFNRARGFCYFNDPVFAVLRLLRAGLRRVLYIDLDAHHGDGVQQAFLRDERVRTLSVHEDKRWPNTGPASDFGSGYACNVPVPAQCHDGELAFVADQLILPLTRRWQPEAIVMTCGADACAGDPLSSMQFSNVAQWSVVDQLAGLAPAVVIVGGGGYNPWTLTRYWAGLWATLSGQLIPAALPDNARQTFDDMTCDLIDDDEVLPQWLNTLTDDVNQQPVRPAMRATVDAVLSGLPALHWQVAPAAGASQPATSATTLEGSLR